jgi:hypothetical protein
MATLDALIAWLKLDRAAVYNAAPTSASTTPDKVEALVKADEKLDAQAAETLSAIFRAAYGELLSRKN